MGSNLLIETIAERERCLITTLYFSLRQRVATLTLTDIIAKFQMIPL